MDESSTSRGTLAMQRSAQRGDLEAFGLLVNEHQRSIRAFITARIDDPFEAEDLAQEVFLVAYRKLAEIDPNQPFRPWLFAIAVNLVRNYHRKRRVAPMGGGDEVLELINSEIETLDAHWRDAPVFEALEQCLAKLGANARDLVRLRYEDGLEIAEIRDSVGGKHSAITMKLHRLRQQLRNCIEGRLGETSHG